MDRQEARICMFGSEFAPSENGVFVGGAISSAANLSRALSEAGYDVDIISLPPRDWDYDTGVSVDWAEITIASGKPQHVSLLSGLQTYVSATQTLIEQCRSNDVDIIHSHSGFAILATASVTAGKILDIPVVHSLYCPIPRKNFVGTAERLSSPFGSRMILSQTDHVFAMSETVRQSVEDADISTPVSVLPPIIDAEQFHPDQAPPMSVSISEDRFTVLFVGSLKEVKGLEYLVQAVGELDESIPVQLVITLEREFPEASERWDTIKTLINDANIEESTEVLGIIDDMPNLMAHADVLVAPFLTTKGPSDYPIAVLEAMASGTPVIGSLVGGIEELLKEERGYLVAPGNIEDLVKKLHDVYWSPETNPTREARRFVESEFSESGIVNEIDDRYGSMI